MLNNNLYHHSFQFLYLLLKPILLDYIFIIIASAMMMMMMMMILLLLLSRFSRVQLCNPIDGSPPGSPVPGILQAITLEWVAISFSNAWKCKGKVKSLSSVWLFTIPWTAAYQASPSLGFSRQEYWSGVPSSSLTITPKYTSSSPDFPPDL